MPRGAPPTGRGAVDHGAPLGVRQDTRAEAASRRYRARRPMGRRASREAPYDGRVYSSLRKIDIVSEAPDGTRLLLQTDHRSPDEIDAEPELSMLFALARILGPQRSQHGTGSVVRYVALGGLHPAIARVVASTGAEAEVDRAVVDLSAQPREAPAALADEAFAALGRRVLARERQPATEDGLREIERLSQGAPTEDEDEIGYWTAVAELAAVTGEVIRAQVGGTWVDDTAGHADLPFLFRAAGGDLRINAVGKAVKFLAHGDAESPHQLLRALEDRDTDAGPLLFSLKPAGWPAAAEMVCEPLADLAKSGADVPLVVYGNDHPNTFAMFKRGDTPRDLAAMRAEAIANLAAIDVEVERVELDAITFWVAHGNYFAAEKILDPAFLRAMHASIGELLAAAVPEKGRLFLTNAVAKPETIAAFVAIASGVYQKNEAGRQLSPTVFLVSDGNIVGVAQPSESPAPEPAKKSWVKKLFN